jgi:hypothetical protein
MGAIELLNFYQKILLSIRLNSYAQGILCTHQLLECLLKWLYVKHVVLLVAVFSLKKRLRVGG